MRQRLPRYCRRPVIIASALCIFSLLLCARRSRQQPPWQPLCPFDEPPQPEAFELRKLQPACPLLASLGANNFELLRTRYGGHSVYASQSSKLKEDVSDMDQGGLNEKSIVLSSFIESILHPVNSERQTPPHDYVKMTDGNTKSEGLYGIDFHGVGILAHHELALELRRSHGLRLPANLTWSFWLGAKGSTTAMHIDDVSFNILYVLHGTKRIVLIDPERVPKGRYTCTVPHVGDNSCWGHVDILTEPPPEAVTVVLRTGEALVTPPAWWHSVENLEPTLAVGLNDFPRACSMQRYERVRTGAVGTS